MGHHAGLVLLHHDEGIVLAGKVHLHAVDPHDAHLAAAQRFTAHGHHLTGAFSMRISTVLGWMSVSTSLGVKL